MVDLTHQQYKRLRDMADGHLNLYASVRRYDEMTGDLLDAPEVLIIGYDRPDIGDPDWWKPLLADGLIALPVDATGRCVVTLDGHKAVSVYREGRDDRG